jgi:S1-C subfamily serine protease
VVTTAQISAVAETVDPGLVDVNTVLGYRGGVAAGTGMVLTPDGLVLTNNHVVAGATSITVTDVGDQRTYPASVVGYDRTHDIAVLALSGASGLAVAPLGDSSGTNIGDGVVAIGNAGGTGGVPSAVGGAVTGLDQTITAQDEMSGASEQLTGLIEVNAPIEPGDSGGPLVTVAGRIIGVDTAASATFRRRSVGSDGFAIPIEQAMAVAEQIEAGRASTTVHIGATAFLGVQTASPAGRPEALVLGVTAGSPAQAAGLARGDVITALDGQQVDSPTTLTTVLDQHHPGDHVRLEWVDPTGRTHTTDVVAATGPVG